MNVYRIFNRMDRIRLYKLLDYGNGLIRTNEDYDKLIKKRLI